MAEKRRKYFDGLGLWPAKSKSITADKDLEKILGGVTRLPLKYWKERMFFLGARDDELFKLTGAHFPAKRLRNHRHPVFSLKPLLICVSRDKPLKNAYVLTSSTVYDPETGISVMDNWEIAGHTREQNREMA